jgi:DnaJ-class molecular chaperone
MPNRRDCPACSGTGQHKKCDGNGYTRDHVFGALTLGIGSLYKDKCESCNGTGKCPRCNGKGHIPVDGKR